MSIKSLIQIIIIIVIIIIVGGVYYKYFLDNEVITVESVEQENTEEVVEQENTEEVVEQENTEEVVEQENTEKVVEQENTEEVVEQATTIEVVEKENMEEVVEQVKIEEAIQKTNKKKQTESVDLANNEDKNLVSKKVNKKEKKSQKTKKKIKKKKVENYVKEVEYLTTDRKGNKYKIFAKSGKTNQNNKNVLDLDNVRGIISSETRSNIYFVADYAEYNSSNQSSKFYQNVVITYDEKQITCDNFDIDMESNFAIAYSNVIITDPKSIMKAGKVTLDIETKDININPDENETKVKVITN